MMRYISAPPSWLFTNTVQLNKLMKTFSNRQNFFLNVAEEKISGETKIATELRKIVDKTWQKSF